MPTNLPFACIDSKQLKGSITRLFTSAANVEKSVQQIGLSALYHAAMHRDTCHIERLVAQFPNGSRVERFAAWAQRHFPVTVNTKARTVKLRKTIKTGATMRAVTSDDWNWDDATNEAWHAEHKVTKPAEALDVATFSAKLGRICAEGSKIKATPSMREFALALSTDKNFVALVAKFEKIEAERNAALALDNEAA